MLLHPQAREYLAALEPVPADVEGMRAVTLEQARRYGGPKVEIAEVRDLSLAGVPCRLYHPDPTRGVPAVVHVHGGGWVAGDLNSHDSTCRRLAAESGWAVVAVDYRRSPEHRFPAALDDVEAVTAALQDGDLSTVDGQRLAVLGDSAGGTIATVAARRLGAAGRTPYELQVLIYPVTDTGMDTESYREFAVDRGLTAAAMDFYWNAYGPADRTQPDVAPLRATELTGLPAALILTAEFDPLRDEGEAYAAALAAAGVSVVAHRWLGMIHGFWRMPGAFDAARSAIATVAARLRAPD